MRPLALVLLTGALSAASLPVHETGFTAGPNGLPEGWGVWSPRAEIAPRTFLDPERYRTRPSALAISGDGNAAEYGGWERTVPGVEAGAWYRFTAYYQSTRVPYASLQILPRVDWPGEQGRRPGRRDLVFKSERDGAWTRVTADVRAPARATAAVLELQLFTEPQGAAWCADTSLERIPDPAARP